MAEICPKGHVGRGILLYRERVVCADGQPAFVEKYECESCGEVWYEDECDDDPVTDVDIVDVDDPRLTGEV